MDKMKDKQEIEEEEFYKLTEDIPRLSGSSNRWTLTSDAMFSHGWVRESREEDGNFKHYFIRQYDITPEMMAEVMCEFYEKHKINRGK